jgi:hypothetical protein
LNFIEKAQNVRDRFIAGAIPVDEVVLHIEPILVQAASDAHGQAEVTRIVNALERRIYTENEPRRSGLIVDLLGAAVAFAGAQQGQ